MLKNKQNIALSFSVRQSQVNSLGLPNITIEMNNIVELCDLFSSFPFFMTFQKHSCSEL